MSLRDQIDRLKRTLDGPLLPSKPPMIVRVTGGFPSDGPDIAQIDHMLLQREPYETPALFEARVLDTADAMGARLIVIGGLQPMPQE